MLARGIIAAMNHTVASPAITVFGIPNCDSVKKARLWLQNQGLAYHFHDFKKDGVPPDALARWMQAVGWEMLLNRKGTTWRKLDPALQNSVGDAASAAALMLSQASVIKRPVVQWPDGRITVGFAPQSFADLLP
jgi:Spx/MgsR family transcriptional regulator